MEEDPDWPFKYPNDSLTRTMAAAARRAGTNELDNGSQPSAMVGFSKARSRSATVEDNTNQGGTTMPTVKTGGKPAAKRTNSRKASPVTTAVERTFNTDEKKPETPGTFRFREDHEEPLIVSLYLRKDETEKLFGKRPVAVKVTIEPIF